VCQLAGDTEPSVCMCLNHHVPMEEGDHSECSIELLACPAHRAEQMRAMGYEPGQTILPPAAKSEESSMFKDEDGNPIVGFCLWCNKDSYTADEVEAHNADDMAKCPAFQDLSGQRCWMMRMPMKESDGPGNSNRFSNLLIRLGR